MTAKERIFSHKEAQKAQREKDFCEFCAFLWLIPFWTTAFVLTTAGNSKSVSRDPYCSSYGNSVRQADPKAGYDDHCHAPGHRPTEHHRCLYPGCSSSPGE